MKTKKAEIIKPCPFCASRRVEIARTNPDACWVECGRYACHARTSSRKTRKAAIALWNRRPAYSGFAEITWDMEDKP